MAPRAVRAHGADLVAIMVEILSTIPEDKRGLALDTAASTRLKTGEILRRGNAGPLDIVTTAIATSWDNGEITDAAALLLLAAILGAVEEEAFGGMMA